jgi:divalent metal cation (Fe/Co/Zn/Cd) transporter
MTPRPDHGETSYRGSGRLAGRKALITGGDSGIGRAAAITSAAASIGISIAVLGSRYAVGSGWESVDDWAALVASAVIAFNGISLLRPALQGLMDRMPGAEIMEPVRLAAESVPGVLATEKLTVRKTGMVYRTSIHVQTDPDIPLHEAHVLSGKVKSAIRSAVPDVQSVMGPMEPYEGQRVARGR